MNVVRITYNGKIREVGEGLSLKGFLDELSFHEDMVTVEYNGKVMGKEEYGKTTLKEGDVVKILHFMGGGGRPESWPGLSSGVM